jgi:FixJ family two-component response regulator
MLTGPASTFALPASNWAETLKDEPVICVIDDDEEVGTAVASLVSSLGFRARTFSSAKAFLHAPERAQTACLISDVDMPEMSGAELQAHLTATGDRTPIVFITGHPNRRVEAQVMDAGAVGFLIKPFPLSALEACLRKSLQQPH